MDFAAPPSSSSNHDPTSNPPQQQQQIPMPSASAARPQQPQAIPQQQQQQQQHLQQLQQQQQQQQQLVAMNGINGGGGNMPGGMVPFPAPAGHQAELNYIYGMVEELSRQLADNQRTLEEVVSGVGRVRSRARTHELANDELVDGASDEVKAQDPNLDTLISILSEALEKAKFSRDANAALLTHYATILASMLRQFHDYKAKHVADVSAWHRSYRAQLAEARAENCRLREQVWEMQGRAGQANEALRQFRGRFDDDAARWDRRVDARAVRQELRFWKRMAMPHMAEDDPYWSDDDDLVDAVEKRRLEEVSRLVAEQQLAAAAAGAESADGVGGGGGANGEEDGGVPELSSESGYLQSLLPGQMMGAPIVLATRLGGVPMQRENGPTPPPRPSSAASSTGSSGQ